MTDDTVSNLRLILESPYRVLRDDVLVRTFVGFDDEDEVKVYDALGKSNLKAPYVVVTMIPTLGDQTGVYGDDDVIKIIYFQVSCWARNRLEGTRLMDMCHEALRIGDWNVTPWELMKVRMEGMPDMVQDRDTDLIGIQARYRGMFGR